MTTPGVFLQDDSGAFRFVYDTDGNAFVSLDDLVGFVEAGVFAVARMDPEDERTRLAALKVAVSGDFLSIITRNLTEHVVASDAMENVTDISDLFGPDAPTGEEPLEETNG